MLQYRINLSPFYYAVIPEESYYWGALGTEKGSETLMQQKIALIVGATGLVGRSCLDHLLAEDIYSQVTALVREPVNIEHPKLRQAIIDFEELGNYFNLIRGNDIYCCLGTTMRDAGSRANFYKVDFTYPFEIAKAALLNGADQFLLVSASSANPRSMFYYNRVKGDIERAISRLSYNSIHIFRPSLLLGTRKVPRFGENFAMKLGGRLSQYMIGPIKAYKPVQAETVAEAMVKTALNDHEGVNIIDNLTMLEMINPKEPLQEEIALNSN